MEKFFKKFWNSWRNSWSKNHWFQYDSFCVWPKYSAQRFLGIEHYACTVHAIVGQFEQCVKCIDCVINCCAIHVWIFHTQKRERTRTNKSMEVRNSSACLFNKIKNLIKSFCAISWKNLMNLFYLMTWRNIQTCTRKQTQLKWMNFHRKGWKWRNKVQINTIHSVEMLSVAKKINPFQHKRANTKDFYQLFERKGFPIIHTLAFSTPLKSVVEAWKH